MDGLVLHIKPKSSDMAEGRGGPAVVFSGLVDVLTPRTTDIGRRRSAARDGEPRDAVAIGVTTYEEHN